MNIEQAREVAAKHREHYLIYQEDHDLEVADTIDALLIELGEVKRDRNEWLDEEATARQRYEKAEAELAAIKGQEPIFWCFKDSTGRYSDGSHTQHSKGMTALYLAAGAQAIPAGYTIAPLEPTEEMIEAGEAVEDLYRRGTPDTWRKVYRQMLAAAPVQAGAQPAKPLKPDMFWNSDDAERQHDSIGSFLNDEICNSDLEVGAVFTLWQAKKLPSVHIKVISINEEECEAEYEIIEAAHGIKEQS